MDNAIFPLDIIKIIIKFYLKQEKKNYNSILLVCKEFYNLSIKLIEIDFTDSKEYKEFLLKIFTSNLYLKSPLLKKNGILLYLIITLFNWHV